MGPDGIDLERDAWRLAVSLGIGLLMGLERERRKGSGPARAFAGVRTFALVSLFGGVAGLTGEVAIVAVGLAIAGAVAVAGYLLSDRTDPGVTTEVAIPVAFLIGALAIEQPALAAGAGVAVTVLLASREYLQRFVANVLTEQEVHDGLLLAAAALVVLPLVPDEQIGPYDAFNPFTIWRLVVVVMGISAAGYVALRILGPRVGLPLAGFASGFVSSSATIGAMGSRTKREPGILQPAIAAAVLSTLATVIQMVVVVGATNRETLREIGPSMAGAGALAAVYGAVFGVRAFRHDGEQEMATGRAFEPKSAVIFALTVAAILFVTAVLDDILGETGVTLSAAVAGFADTHAAAISVASLVADGRIEAEAAVVPILAAFTTNSISKAVIARLTGTWTFAMAIWPGLGLVLAGAWAGWLMTR